MLAVQACALALGGVAACAGAARAQGFGTPGMGMGSGIVFAVLGAGLAGKIERKQVGDDVGCDVHVSVVPGISCKSLSRARWTLTLAEDGEISSAAAISS